MFPLNAALKRRSSTVFQHAVCVMRGGVLISRARAFDRKGREGFAKVTKEARLKLGHYKREG
jgi:hypothetical protein